MKFYTCKTCKSIVHFIKDSGVPLICCGKIMEELIPDTSDGATEKHVPIIKQNGNHVFVEVGSVPHPMLDVHYIEWIILETERGFQKVNLKPGMEPKAEFLLTENDRVIDAYEYCNIHGLWKSNK